MGTFAEWRERGWVLPEVKPDRFGASMIGATVCFVERNAALCILIDASNGTAVLLRLTEPQFSSLEAVDDNEPTGEQRSEFRAFMNRFKAWLDSLVLDDMEVIGKCRDPFVHALLQAGFEPVDGGFNLDLTRPEDDGRPPELQ